MGKTVASLTQTATPRHPAKPLAAKHPAACRRSAWAEPQDARWPEALCGWVKGSEGGEDGEEEAPLAAMGAAGGCPGVCTARSVPHASPAAAGAAAQTPGGF